ncbi:MAG: PIN domain-containing protein [Anaerolineaceae bacterium]|nr:PIN domain-containing protein [Anaerolineaceae bacterium]
MSDAGYVLDTNIVIERGKRSPDRNVIRWFDSVPRDRLFLTPPVYDELLKGIDETDRENPARQRKWLEEFRARYGWLELPGGRPVFMTEGMARVLVENNGSIPKKIYVDFFIGMIAINHEMVVVTRNEKDFRRLGIPFTNPFGFRG